MIDYRALFEAAPTPYLVLSPDLEIVAVNEAYLAATLTTRDGILGRPLFEVFPDNPDDPSASGVRNLSASLRRVLATGEADTMPLQRYDIRRPPETGGAFEERWWSPVNTPVHDADGRITTIIHRVLDVTELVRLRREGEAREELTRIQGETIERSRIAFHALRQSEERRFRAVADLVPDLLWSTDLAGRIDWFNKRWRDYTGERLADGTGQGWLDVVHPDDREEAEALLNASFAAGTAFEQQRRLRRHDGAYRWFLIRGEPLLTDSGEVLQWFGAATDVDDLRRMKDQQAIMVAELQHRTRNLIAVVRSVALQTLKNTTSVEDFGEEFSDRLEALSRVQGLLSRSDEEPITLGTLVRLELDALAAEADCGRIIVDGPEVTLRNSAVQTLALALHELATNARKHGALATSEGTLAVKWKTVGDGAEGERLAIEWVESGRAEVAQTDQPRYGYGRILLERALPYSLGAETAFELHDEGVRCRIDLPLKGS